MNYLGHISADALSEIVERGVWLQVELGRTVRHMSIKGRKRRQVWHTGPRVPFAACSGCGKFDKIGAIWTGVSGTTSHCSADCV